MQNTVRRSLVFSFAEKYTALAIATVSVMILSRLLTPEEIGIYSVGLAVVGLCQVFREFGVGQYLIQEKELSPQLTNTAFTVTSVLALAAAGLLMALSGPVAAFYDSPDVAHVIFYSSLAFLVAPVSSIGTNLLRRQMNFQRLYFVGIASALAGAVVAVGFAFAGEGYMSLVWGALANAVTAALAVLLLCPSARQLRPSNAHWRRVTSFGAQSTAISVLGTLGFRIPDLAIGRLIGFVEVGLFSRAFGLYTLFHQSVLQGVLPVLLPTFSLSQREGRPLRGLFLYGTTLFSVICWPFYGFLALMAGPIIRVLFGDQWDAAIPLARWLCITGMLLPFMRLSNEAFIAIGRIDLNLKLQTIHQLTRIALVIGACFIGLEAVAASIAFPTLLYAVMSHRQLMRLLGYGLRDLLQCSSKSLAVTAFSLVIPTIVALTTGFGHDHALLLVLGAGSGLAAGWLLGVWVTRHPILQEIQIYLSAAKRKAGAVLGIGSSP